MKRPPVVLPPHVSMIHVCDVPDKMIVHLGITDFDHVNELFGWLEQLYGYRTELHSYVKHKGVLLVEWENHEQDERDVVARSVEAWIAMRQV